MTSSLRKQELIHLHGLLAQVRNHYEERAETDIDTSEYDALNTRPTSVHKNKIDHKKAVFALAEEMDEGMLHPEDPAYEETLETSENGHDLPDGDPANAGYDTAEEAADTQYLENGGDTEPIDTSYSENGEYTVN